MVNLDTTLKENITIYIQLLCNKINYSPKCCFKFLFGGNKDICLYIFKRMVLGRGEGELKLARFELRGEISLELIKNRVMIPFSHIMMHNDLQEE